jgi:glycosyltransferase involved in cell wall biosynthesis
MIMGKKVVVVLPALNAESTLRETYADMPHDIVDEIVLVDDASEDATVRLAESLGIHHVLLHTQRSGYGANQKTCYDKALAIGADIVVMLHPDYQYTPRLITAMSSIIAQGVYPVVFGSRILGGGALRGGMPLYKYVANRLLTLAQNLLLGQKLSEYHTGYRAYAREVLESVNYPANSDDFVFDNQMIVQIFERGFAIAEVTCPTRYFPEASSINFRRSVTYGMGVLQTSFLGLFRRLGWSRSVLFDPKPKAA